MCNADNSGKLSEREVDRLLQEQSKELMSYIDSKLGEMEELIAESEGRISEQLREGKK